MDSPGHKAGGRTARRPPLSPRTKLFQSQQFDLLKALDIVLLNISSERARKQLREEFRSKGDSLSKDEFVSVVLRILPDELQFRSPLGMGDGMENAQLNVGLEMSESQRQDVAANLVDRVDTDGDGRIDWNEMSAFILFQSAVVAQSDFTVGRMLPYRPLHEGGAVGRAGAAAEAKGPKPVLGLVSTDRTKDRLADILKRRQAGLRGGIRMDSLSKALRPHQAQDVAKAVAELEKVSRRKAAEAVGLQHSAKPVMGPGASAFNRSGIYGGVTLLQYVPKADLLAVVEPKVPGVRLLDPDDLSSVGTLDSGGRSIEAVASFEAAAEEGVPQLYLAAASANATISLFSMHRRPFDGPAINVWPTPDAQQSLLYTHRYRLLLSGSSSEGSLHVWNVRTGGLLASMHGHADMCTGLADMADEDRIASASHDKTVRVWDVNTCACETTLTGHKRGVCGVGVYQDRGLLVSGSYDHTARVWSPRVGRSVMVLEGHSAPLIGVECVPDSHEVITASIDGDACVWDMRRPREPVHTFTVKERTSSGASGLESSASQMTAFVLCLRRRPKATDVVKEKSTAGAPLRPAGRKFKRKMPVRTPEGTTAVAAKPADAGLSEEGTPTIIAERDVLSGDPMTEEAISAAAAEAVARKHDRIASAATDGDGEAGRVGRMASSASMAGLARTLSGEIAPAGPGVARTSSGGSGAGAAAAAAGSADAGARALRRAKSVVKSGGQARLDHEAVARRPRQVEVAERSVQQLVFGIKTLHSFTQREAPELLEKSHREPVVAVAYSPLNHTILSAAGTGVRVWSALVGVLTGHFEDVVGPGEALSSMIIDPRGVTFVVGTESGRVQQHNATSGHCIRRLSSHAGPVPAMAWLGRSVVSVGWDARVFLHSVKETPGLMPDKHSEIGAAYRHDGHTTCVAASDTLGLIATGGTDCCVRVFNASTSQMERRLPHNAMVTAVLFVPELSVIVSTDLSATVFVWLIKSGVARYALAGAFRHRPTEWLDPKKHARVAAKHFRGLQRKRTEKKRFVRGLKARAPQDGAAGDGMPSSVGMSPRAAARAQKRRELKSVLAAHEARTQEAAGPAHRLSLAERMMQGDEAAMEEFRLKQEAKRSSKRAPGSRLRASILLGAGSSVLSSPKPKRSSAPAMGDFDESILDLGAGNVASPTHVAGSPMARTPQQRRRASEMPGPTRPRDSAAGHSAASTGPAAGPGKSLLSYVKDPHVLAMFFDQEEYLLFTGTDKGSVNCWDLKAFLTAVEVQSLRGAKAAGVDQKSVRRRLSVDMSDADVHSAIGAARAAGGAAAKGAGPTAPSRKAAGRAGPMPRAASGAAGASMAQVDSKASTPTSALKRQAAGRSPRAAAAARAKARTESSAAPAPPSPSKLRATESLQMLASAGNSGAFHRTRQPVLPEGQAHPLVLASGLVKLVWESCAHDEAVTGLAVLRNPHMPETILSCGFDQCVRGSDSEDGNVIGRLCQKLTSTSVNPHWNMVVDADSWRSGASVAAAEATQAADVEAKAMMDTRSGASPPRRSRSRTVAMVESGQWKGPASGAAAPAGRRGRAGAAAGVEEGGSVVDSELELFQRAAAAVPLPKELRFSEARERTGPTAASRARVAMALRQALDDDDDGDEALRTKARR